MSHPPFLWPIRVYYEDTDAGGVVYHSRYLNFMERARSEWLRAHAIEQESLFQETGLRFVVAQMEIHFLAPARFDQLLMVSVVVVERKRASLWISQEIHRQGHHNMLIGAKVRIACVDAAFRPARLPTVLLAQPFNPG